MKKLLSVFLAAMLILSLSSAALASEEVPAGMITGGWEITAYEPEGAALPEEVQAAFEKAMETLDGATCVPVRLLAAQVVAGMNYCILSQITPVVPDAKTRWALVYIYADLEGNAEILNIYELYIDRHAQPAE